VKEEDKNILIGRQLHRAGHSAISAVWAAFHPADQAAVNSQFQPE